MSSGWIHVSRESISTVRTFVGWLGSADGEASRDELDILWGGRAMSSFSGGVMEEYVGCSRIRAARTEVQ